MQALTQSLQNEASEQTTKPDLFFSTRKDEFMKNINCCLFFAIIPAMIMSVFGCADSRSTWEQRAKNPAIIKALETWVDANVHADAKPSDIAVFSGSSPGTYALKSRFDWSIFGMSSVDRAVLLVSNGNDRPVSVYFGEHSRCGILVAVRDQFGVPKEAIHFSSGRIALYSPDFPQNK